MKILNIFLFSIQTLTILSIWQNSFDIVECRHVIRSNSILNKIVSQQIQPLQQIEQESSNEDKKIKEDGTKQETKNNISSSHSDFDLAKQLNSIEKEIHDLSEQIGKLAKSVNDEKTDIEAFIKKQNNDNDNHHNNNNNNDKNDNLKTITHQLQIPINNFPNAINRMPIPIDRLRNWRPLMKAISLRDLNRQNELNDQTKSKTIDEKNDHKKLDEKHENDQNQIRNYDNEDYDN